MICFLILKIWHFKFTLVSAIKSSVCREDGTVIIDACRTANAEKLINQLPEVTIGLPQIYTVLSGFKVSI